MKSNNEKFKEMIDDRSTDERTIIPTGISILALMSVVARKPIGYIPSIIAIFIMYERFFASADEPLGFLGLLAMFWTYLAMTFGATLFVSKRMVDDGVMDSYMSMVFADYAIPRFLKKKFGIAVDGDNQKPQ